MALDNGIVNLTGWLGNVILPTLSGLFFAIPIIRFVGAGQHQNWMYGGFLCLMTSAVAVVLLLTFKYGKPRGYLRDWWSYQTKPHVYCGLERDSQLNAPYLMDAEGDY